MKAKKRPNNRVERYESEHGMQEPKGKEGSREDKRQDRALLRKLQKKGGK